MYIPRNLHLLLLLFFYSVVASASPVSETYTSNVANNFFIQKNQSRGHIVETLCCKYGNMTVAHVHNFSKGGWVMVSADDAIEPIVAYNFSDQYQIKTSDSIQTTIFQSLLAKIEENKTKSFARSPKWDVLSKVPSVGLKSFSQNQIGNLLVNDKGEEIKWNQTDYYNDYCPTQDGKHCLVGCIPTAASMIMYKRQWPTNYLEEDIIGSPAIDWSSMESKLTHKNDAVAQLMATLGKHAKAEYGIESTGCLIDDLVRTLTDYGYFCINVTISSRFFEEPFVSNEEFINIMRSEIMQGRPVLFSGTQNRSVPGHTFVVSGMDSEDENFFYCNLGWGGSYNGFYNFSDKVDVQLPYLKRPEELVHHIMPIRKLSTPKPSISNVLCKTGVGGYVEADVENANSYLLLTIKKVFVIDSLYFNGTLFTNEGYKPKIVTRNFGPVDGDHLKVDCSSRLIDDATLYCLVVYSDNGEYVDEQRFFDGSECEFVESDMWSGTEASICQEELPISWHYYECIDANETNAVEIMKQDAQIPFSISFSDSRQYICIASDIEDYNLTLIDMQGRSVANYNSLKSNSVLNIGNLPTGVYNVLFKWQDNHYTCKIVKK